MSTAITFGVTTESDAYGPECTTEEAVIIADYIGDRLLEYGDTQGYDLTVRTVSHSDGRNPYADYGAAPYDDNQSAEALAWWDLQAYVEAHWVDWVGEALAGEEAEERTAND